MTAMPRTTPSKKNEFICYQQNLLVRYKTETGHATGSLALPLTHPARPDC